jgi:hypothetical protein
VAWAGKLPGGEYVFLSTNGANGTLYRVDGKGKITKTINVGQMYYWAFAQLLPNNKALVTLRNGIAEIDLESGKVIRTIQTTMPYSVQRLPNGNFLAAYNNSRKIAEIDRDGKEIWKMTPDGNHRPWRAKRR